MGSPRAGQTIDTLELQLVYSPLLMWGKEFQLGGCRLAMKVQVDGRSIRVSVRAGRSTIDFRCIVLYIE